VKDIITLLPDNVANQIAAGEVIQRPASAVKELLENAIDAGATEIKLIIADAGKALIQVIDNGKGMSETDARMCFERHATSKIKTIDDLFQITSMGFRGEALASIAAVAQIELKTKTHDATTGTYLAIENSQVLQQAPIAVLEGTSIAMKNLFFNVPARRNFLKSNSVELRHIIDEFTRVSMAQPQIAFTFISNEQTIFQLEKGSLKQRIVQLLGNAYNAKMIQVQENTDYLNIHGFVGKPDTAKKTRGDQYFFVNNRFVKSAYLNHAVISAFQGLLPADTFPTYVLFIDIDPACIDINVHPTKQEIKFEDEKITYAFIQSAVKHALAQFSVAPSIEFNLDSSIQKLEAIEQPFTAEKQITATGSALFNNYTQKHQAHFIETVSKKDAKHWKDFFEPNQPSESNFVSLLSQLQQKETFIPYEPTVQQAPLDMPSEEIVEVLSLQGMFLICNYKRNIYIIHQQRAHEKVLYEQYCNVQEIVATQHSLFPVTLEFAPADAVLLKSVLPDLQQLGYLIEPFGGNSFVIQGTPADIKNSDDKAIIEEVLEQLKHFTTQNKLSVKQKIAQTLAKQHAIKTNQLLTDIEMQQLVKQLFACSQPHIAPSGTVFMEITSEQLTNFFN
jgi:DNA mismatch repair protein MutL